MAQKSPAEQIIELFGGIRPMASKLDVAVTTVQGWKKRQFIPEHRYDIVREGAEKENIGEKVAFLLNEQIIDGDNSPDEEISKASSQPPTPESQKQYSRKQKEQGYTPRPMPEYTFKPERQHHWIASFSISIISVTLALSILSILFFAPDLLPFVKDNNNSAQETAYYQEKNRALEAQVSQYHEQVEEMKERIKLLVKATQAMQSDIVTLRQSSEPARMAEIEQSLDAIRQSNEELRSTVSALQTIEGQPADMATIDQIQKLVEAVNTRIESMQSDLNQTQTAQESLTSNLNTMQGQDMAFASLVLSANNISDAIGKGQPFEGDLNVLKMLLGFDPEISNTINRLEPYAAQGIKDPNNMAKMLQMLSGDIVSAEYEGRDLSLKERAMKELGNQISIRKAGELPAGDDAEAVIARAKLHLEEGQADAALAELNKLDGKAARAANPVTSELQAYLLADQLITQLSKTLAEYVPSEIMNGVIKPWLNTTRDAARLKFPSIKDMEVEIPYKLPTQGGKSLFDGMK